MAIAAAAIAQQGSAHRGKTLLFERGCVGCHSVDGMGGRTAPDLSMRSVRRFLPATLTASMWNHGPAMWQAMGERGLQVPQLTEAEINDLYAYFYALRYFDPPGDAGRGRRVFTQKKCNECHSLIPQGEPNRQQIAGIGPPVTDWESLLNPAVWAAELWNHGEPMKRWLDDHGHDWPRISAQEMSDLLVYLQNRPGAIQGAVHLEFPEVEKGREAFQRLQCSHCHTAGAEEAGKVDLSARPDPARSMVDLAAAMWNHRPDMAEEAAARSITLSDIEGEQMSGILSYLRAAGFFEDPGKAGRGRRLFKSKSCAGCHGDRKSGAPDLEKSNRDFTAATLAAAVWRHGPQMLERMRQTNIAWPSLSDSDVADLLAYLNR